MIPRFPKWLAVGLAITALAVGVRSIAASWPAGPNTIVADTGGTWYVGLLSTMTGSSPVAPANTGHAPMPPATVGSFRAWLIARAWVPGRNSPGRIRAPGVLGLREGATMGKLMRWGLDHG